MILKRAIYTLRKRTDDMEHWKDLADVKSASCVWVELVEDLVLCAILGGAFHVWLVIVCSGHRE